MVADDNLPFFFLPPSALALVLRVVFSLGMVGGLVYSGKLVVSDLSEGCGRLQEPLQEKTQNGGGEMETTSVVPRDGQSHES